VSLAADAIADLDAEIREHGQDVTLVRIMPDAADVERPHRAFVRGYRPDEMVGGLQQGDTLVTLSPTGLPPEFADTDSSRLVRNDLIRIDGRLRNVEFVEPVRVAGRLVRLRG
jgi:hypothetical protein